MKQVPSESIFELREGIKLRQVHPYDLGISIPAPPPGAQGVLCGEASWKRLTQQQILLDFKTLFPSSPQMLPHPSNRPLRFSELLQQLRNHRHFQITVLNYVNGQNFLKSSLSFNFWHLLLHVWRQVLADDKNELTSSILTLTEKWGNSPSCLAQQLRVIFVGLGVYSCDFTVHI